VTKYSIFKFLSLFVLISVMQVAAAQMVVNNRIKRRLFSAKHNNQVDFWRIGEVLSPDSMLINGKVSSLTTTKLLKSALNKPDSVTQDIDDCCTYWENPYEQDYWYGKTTFLALADSAIIKEIFFDDDKFFIKTPVLTFDKNTTFDDVCKAFPVDCKLVEEREVTNIRTNVKAKYTAFDVRMNKVTDDIWSIYFKDNKLVFIASASGN